MCGRATQPEPSTPSPQAVGGDPHDARRARCARAAEESARVSGGVDGGAGPAIGGNGSTRLSARSTVLGGAMRVQPLQDRASCCTSRAQLRLARELQQHGAGDPDEREPERGAGDEAAERVEQPQRRDRRASAAARERPGDRRRPPAAALAPTSAPTSADERRVRRARAAVQEVRREPRAEHRAGREPGERERGRDQPAPAGRRARRARRSPSAIQSTRVTRPT